MPELPNVPLTMNGPTLEHAWRWLRIKLLVTLIALTMTMVVGAQLTAETLAFEEQEAFQAAVRAVEDSVVQIRTVGGLEEIDGHLVAQGPTTGLVISPDGYIVSSAFNFAQGPASTLVTLPDGQQMPADLVATDHSRMLVLLKARQVSNLSVPEFVPIDEAQVGAWAIAVGRTFRPDVCNMTIGILSATNRMLGKALQTDAAISPANYGGPLIDAWGRVYGVIVPLAPQGTSVTAGTQWYDSGIGFAVPLAALADALERMKCGEDQHAGVLGIGLARGNPFEDPATIAVVRPQSPAAIAGLESGDRIVNADGLPITTRTGFRLFMGPKYAGDVVSLTVDRAGESVTHDVTLSGPLGPFQHAFLGILPLRQRASAESAEQIKPPLPRGVGVRMVLAGSPAEAAGIRAGDRIAGIDGEAINDLSQALDATNRLTIGETVSVDIVRSDELQKVPLVTAAQSSSVPEELPPGGESVNDSQSAGDLPTAGMRLIKLADFANECNAYVPNCVRQGLRPALLLRLHAPGGDDPPSLIQAWQPWCEEHELLMLVPQATDTLRWGRADLAYLKRLLQNTIRDFNCDPHRIVVHGDGEAGKMAYLFGLAERQTVRGISVTAAVFPRRPEPPNAEPTPRLAFFAAVPNALSLQSNVALRRLHEAGYAVRSVNIPGETELESRELSGELARWIDTLDRF